MKKRLKKIMIAIICLFLLIVGGFYIWTQIYYKATAEAFSLVQETEDNYLIFGAEDATTGFIFYPGAKVEAEAYSYLGAALDQEDYFVVIPKMPLKLALLGINEAQHIMDQYNQVENWFVGGHSLGGAMVSRFAYLHQELIEGIIFLASYPADDLSQSNIPILSIYGELDGLATLEKMSEKNQLLSNDSTLFMIEGGNHANFGMYGSQKGDYEALISNEDQRHQTLEVILNWLKERGY